MNMDFDISLDLDLGIGHLHEQKHIQIHKKKAANPSLTLGVVEPPDNIIHRETNNNYHVATKTESCEYINNLHPHVSSPNMVSSFSNSSISRIAIKRERDDQFNSEEHEYEAEKVPFVDVDFDENGNPNNKKKLRLTKEQSEVLEHTFKDHSTLTPKQKQELARKLNLRTRQVEVWFQNRRARTKLKQTEVDCEELKKCYETLTEENKRLEKELKELKSTEEPFNYNIQLPVANLNICPSCKRICTGNGGESSKNAPSPTTTLLLGPKAHLNFYTNTNNYTVTQSSATIAS